MKVVIQRVLKSRIIINNEIYSQIKKGLMILVSFEKLDSIQDIEWLVNKICQLRIFNDNEGLMNLSVNDINGEIQIVSQFTLHAKIKKGNRPSFILAAKPNVAQPLYTELISKFKEKLPGKIRTGKFGANMKIELINDGPVTIIIDTKNKE